MKESRREWDDVIAAYQGLEPPHRFVVLDITVRKLAGALPVERFMRGRLGWTIGGQFLSLEHVLTISAGELETEMLILRTAAARERALADGRTK